MSSPRARSVQDQTATLSSESKHTSKPATLEIELLSKKAMRRSNVRGDVYQVISELKHVEEAQGVTATEKKRLRE